MPRRLDRSTHRGWDAPLWGAAAPHRPPAHPWPRPRSDATGAAAAGTTARSCQAFSSRPGGTPAGRRRPSPTVAAAAPPHRAPASSPRRAPRTDGSSQTGTTHNASCVQSFRHSGTGLASASRRIVTICSSVNRVCFAPSWILRAPFSQASGGLKKAGQVTLTTRVRRRAAERSVGRTHAHGIRVAVDGTSEEGESTHRPLNRGATQNGETSGSAGEQGGVIH